MMGGTGGAGGGGRERGRVVVRSAIGSACARPSSYGMIGCALTPSSLAGQVDVLGERVRMCHCVRVRASCRAGGVVVGVGGWMGGMVYGRMEGGKGERSRAYVVGVVRGSGMASPPRPRRGVGVRVGLWACVATEVSSGRLWRFAAVALCGLYLWAGCVGVCVMVCVDGCERAGAVAVVHMWACAVGCVGRRAVCVRPWGS
jgi:hypothetical protein